MFKYSNQHGNGRVFPLIYENGTFSLTIKCTNEINKVRNSRQDTQVPFARKITQVLFIFV